MIKVKILRNKNKEVYGFSIRDHGKSFVCAAVSILAINTVNSIESFTEEKFVCDYKENGGFIYFELPRIKNGETNRDVKLLLDSLVLGLEGVAKEYSNEITVIHS